MCKLNHAEMSPITNNPEEENNMCKLNSKLGLYRELSIETNEVVFEVKGELYFDLDLVAVSPINNYYQYEGKTFGVPSYYECEKKNIRYEYYLMDINSRDLFDKFTPYSNMEVNNPYSHNFDVTKFSKELVIYETRDYRTPIYLWKHKDFDCLAVIEALSTQENGNKMFFIDNTIDLCSRNKNYNLYFN